MNSSTIVARKFLSTEEAADFIGGNKRTMEGWRQKNMGPYFIRVGDASNSKVVYPIEGLLLWLAQRTTSPEPKCLRPVVPPEGDPKADPRPQSRTIWARWFGWSRERASANRSNSDRFDQG